MELDINWYERITVHTDSIDLVNLQWHSQNKVGNVGIFVLWRDREKL